MTVSILAEGNRHTVEDGFALGYLAILILK